MKLQNILIGLCLAAGFVSCKTIKTDAIYYQSVRTRHAQPTPQNPIPNEAKIAVSYMLDAQGNLTATVFNRTAEIMTIDQTLSFLIDINGKSTSYYDPTVRTTTTTDLTSATRGASVNMGAVSRALGIGGGLGKLASGINLGGANTQTTAVTNSTYIADQPKVSIGPNGSGIMSKIFNIGTIPTQQTFTANRYEDSPYHFTVCITYSTDNGATFNRLVSEFYVNSFYNIPLRENGRINDALRQLYQQKPDAINEQMWNLSCITTTGSFKLKGYDDKNISNGITYDYQ